MRTTTLMAALVLALTAAQSSAQTVTYDYDRNADFSKLKTYAWVNPTNIGDDFSHKRIVSAIDKQLAAKGLTPAAANSTPDVIIAYNAVLTEDAQINGFSSGFGGWRFGGDRSGSASVDRVMTGTLVVAMVDAKRDSMLWRGTATKTLDMKADPEHRDKNINKAVEKMFKKFPSAK
jgi:hypothetical protein